jgi:sugar lactone lactonase YvrE
LYVDANGTLYVCDQQNNRVQMWINGTTSGVTVAGSSTGFPGTTSTLLRQPYVVIFDDNGFMYVSDWGNNRVQRFPPNSLNGTTVAGQAGGSGSTALDSLRNPAGIAVDNNSNLYIADTGNSRVMLWAPNAISGTILISSSLINNMNGLLLAPGSSNQVYLSTQFQRSVYLWTFGASTPNVTLTQVSGSPNILNNPYGITLDPYGNLYVADRSDNRVVMYCANSTVGIIVVGGTSVLNQPIAIALDSNLNLYVATQNGNNVVQYALL